MEDEANKIFEQELKKFGQKCSRHFQILEDAALLCDLCKTPEMSKSLSIATIQYLDSLSKFERDLNKRIENAIKGLKTPPEPKSFLKSVNKTIGRFNSVHLGKNKKLSLDFKQFKDYPELRFTWKF